ncbi:MAG: DUF4129 domain-containing protein [Bacteroidetes bacterium]|nr:DUF4129 domain-containing protein [Bacteroidota bacterium]
MLLVVSLTAGAQDSAIYADRSFDQTALKKYAGQKEFIYEVDTPPAQMSIWQWIKYKISEWLAKTLGESGEITIWKVILYGLLIFAIVAIILNLAGIDIRRLMVGGPRAVLAATVAEEDIAGMDMDQLIAQATSQRQWRLAVRYQYLKALQMMTDRQMIHWRPGKTNMDYYHELNGDQLKTAFLVATDDFENVWYGNNIVTEQHYADSKSALTTFYTLIEGQKAP